MTVLVRSLLQQSDIPQEMKRLLCLHFSLVINLLVCYKAHTLLWLGMNKAFVNTILFIFSQKR